MEYKPHVPECVGCQCPCYGNCEGFHEGELECIQSGGAWTVPAFFESSYVFAPYVPLSIPDPDFDFSATKDWVRAEIMKTFMLPGYIVGIDTGEKR